ncbi:MAG: thioredoxin domain-containing protein [Pseudonocardia sp.]|uniref:DsbA family protein n=2 Tax=unclassified Pseudonocardia TaxID=2619320 RepID=UPI00086B007E|nr:thioredoxin domain-containing protein [Pseudonocardia sp.]MBN9109429.1 thioredoxin domain-containing protein [Pseudonocardia sp.]ODU29932.1 MAG: protein-disulfide isomerase [Pseudonocardia sp. SCN 72-51]
MGGASRSEKSRKQAANQRLAAAGITPKQSGPSGGTRIALIVVAAVVVVAGVIGYFVIHNRQSTTPDYAVAASGTVVTAGKSDAPVTVDVYEDYLCPVCERFESRYADDVTAALNDGKIKVNYHSTAILDSLTTPPGYSTLAANAALCAVPAGIWPAYHKALYDDQPTEKSAGLTAQQLVQKGVDLGAKNADWSSCVTGNGNAAAIAAATKAAIANPALLTNGQFGTPTILVGGKKIDLNDSKWLSNAIAGK